MASVWEELKRRNVVKAALAYVIVGWLLAQVAEFATETFGAPDWILKALMISVAVGFPVVLVIAWAFELAAPKHMNKKEQAAAPAAARGAGRRARGHGRR